MYEKILRIITVSTSLEILLKDQLIFLNQYYELVGVASDSDFQTNSAWSYRL